MSSVEAQAAHELVLAYADVLIANPDAVCSENLLPRPKAEIERALVLMGLAAVLSDHPDAEPYLLSLSESYARLANFCPPETATEVEEFFSLCSRGAKVKDKDELLPLLARIKELHHASQVLQESTDEYQLRLVEFYAVVTGDTTEVERRLAQGRATAAKLKDASADQIDAFLNNRQPKKSQ